MNKSTPDPTADLPEPEHTQAGDTEPLSASETRDEPSSPVEPSLVQRLPHPITIACISLALFLGVRYVERTWWWPRQVDQTLFAITALETGGQHEALFRQYASRIWRGRVQTSTFAASKKEEQDQWGHLLFRDVVSSAIIAERHAPPRCHVQAVAAYERGHRTEDFIMIREQWTWKLLAWTYPTLPASLFLPTPEDR